MKRKSIINTVAPAPIADAPEYKRPVRFAFKTTEFEATYLQVGDVVCVQGREHVVESVNASCARVIPITEGTPKQVSFKPKFAEKAVTFTAPERNNTLSISANSELEILRRLGAGWRERL